MRLLDLFCGAGGCARGYQMAGFHVTGVDINPQPRYVGDAFVRADALEYLASADLSGYDVIHASPPCHDHSNVSGRNRKAAGPKGTGWMLTATLRQLQRLAMPYVVENVETADFPVDLYRVKLCGSSFGLNVRRHRWFASNVAMLTPPCAHHWQKPRFRSLDSRRPAGSLATVVGVHGHTNYAGEFELRCAAMDIDWMTPEELTQAIPPAYTAFIGEALMEHLAVAA